MSITWDVYRNNDGLIVARVVTLGVPGAPMILRSKPMEHYRNARYWAKTTKRLIKANFWPIGY